MKVITFQSKEALKYLEKNGYLRCEDKYIDKDRNVINVIMQGTITAKISKKGIVVSFSVLHSI